MNLLFESSAKFSFILELLAACLLFVLPLKKRAHPFSGFLLGAVACIGAALTGSWLRGNLWLTALFYLLQVAAAFLPVRFSCDVSAGDTAYAVLCAYGTQHFASALYIFVGSWSGLISFSESAWINPATAAFYLLVYAGVYTAFYWLFARPLAHRGEYQAGPFQVGSLAALILPIALVLSPMGKITAGGQDALMLNQVYSMLCSAFVLCVQVSHRKALHWQRELAAQEQLWRSQKEQYQISKAQIELINHKYHDLKHQIAALRTVRSEERRDASLREVEQAATIYDAAAQTGNEVLDVVLTEKSLLCEKKNIHWTCMADGSRLNFLDPVDLYAIFGNALDNAIEGVEELREPEKRVIAVTVFNRDKLAVLQIENYYDRQLQFQDGLPRSSKGNDAYHGFGMKSIRRTVEKYNGSLSVQTEGNIFVLSIVFPIPEH